VLRSAISSTEKVVLVSLAEFADSDGSNCRPGIAALSGFASVNERTCRRALDGLEGTWFTRTERRVGGQAWRSYVYRLLIPEGADIAPAPLNEGEDKEPAPSEESTGHSARTLEATCGHSRQKVRTLTTEGAGTVSDDLAHDLAQDIEGKALSPIPCRFPEFWAAYPRKVAKAKALSIWTRRKLDTHADAILADVQARAVGDEQWMDPQFIPHPTTYLSQERWEDEWARSRGKVDQPRESLADRSARHLREIMGKLPREQNAAEINERSMQRLGLRPGRRLSAVERVEANIERNRRERRLSAVERAQQSERDLASRRADEFTIEGSAVRINTGVDDEPF